MSDVVKNERRELKRLRDGISRYARELHAVAGRARSDMSNRVREAETVASERKQALRRAESNLAEAQAALARCRENCGGLAAAVRVAQNAAGEARAADARARRAVQQATSAQRDLDNSLRHIEAALNDQSTAAESALAALDARLAALGPSSADKFRAAATTAVFVGNMASAGASLGQMSATALQGLGVDTPGSSQSLGDEVQRQNTDNLQWVVEKLREDEDSSRKSGGDAS